MRAQKIGLYVVGGLSVVFGAAFVAIMNIFVRAFFFASGIDEQLRYGFSVIAFILMIAVPVLIVTSIVFIAIYKYRIKAEGCENIEKKHLTINAALTVLSAILYVFGFVSLYF